MLSRIACLFACLFAWLFACPFVSFFDCFMMYSLKKNAQKKAAGEKEAKRRLAEAQNGNEVVGDAEEGHVPKVVEEERVSEEEGDTNAGVTQAAANGGGAEETELLWYPTYSSITRLQCKRKGGYQPDNRHLYLWSCMCLGIRTHDEHHARQAHVASRATATSTRGSSGEIESGTAGRWRQTKTARDSGRHAREVGEDTRHQVYDPVEHTPWRWTVLHKSEIPCRTGCLSQGVCLEMGALHAVVQKQ